MTISIMTISMAFSVTALTNNHFERSAQTISTLCYCAECQVLIIVMLNKVMLGVILLNDIMLSVEDPSNCYA
jgi:hypothetical protein